MADRPKRLRNLRHYPKARPPWPEVYLEGGEEEEGKVVIGLKKTWSVSLRKKGTSIDLLSFASFCFVSKFDTARLKVRRRRVDIKTEATTIKLQFSSQRRAVLSSGPLSSKVLLQFLILNMFFSYIVHRLTRNVSTLLSHLNVNEALATLRAYET